MAMRRLTVSRATLRFLRQGHPWVRPDKHTLGLDALDVGEAIELVDEDGAAAASALADPGAPVCARVYSFAPATTFDPIAAFARAWKRRAALHADPATDCYRMVHGEADGLPGLRVERYGAAVVVLIQAACARAAAEAVAAEIAKRLPTAAIAIREHLTDLRREAPSARRFGGGELDTQTAFDVRELGVRLRARPFDGLATGVYVDQRATRAWLRGDVAGKRVLNLFAYTGAFSASLLAAGAREALDVDLSAPALRWAQEHAELNGVAERHRIEHGDCLGFVAAAAARGETWDIVIIDPPTAAQGAGGWVAARDYPRLLDEAVRLLAPGGRLVACLNTHGARFDLERALARAAQLGRCVVERGPALGVDLPLMKGFPEGRPYVLATCRRQ